MAKKKLVEVKFLRSPSGSFKLAYHAGDHGFVDANLVTKLIDQGFAELIDGTAETGQSNKAGKAENATNEPKKKPGRKRPTQTPSKPKNE
jgi:hypothetical protein